MCGMKQILYFITASYYRWHFFLIYLDAHLVLMYINLMIDYFKYKDVIMESGHTDHFTQNKLKKLLHQEPVYYTAEQVNIIIHIYSYYHSFSLFNSGLISVSK